VIETLNQIAPLLVIGVGLAVVGSVLGILWYRTVSPSNFDKAAVLFIIKMFSAIGAGTIVLGLLMRR